MKKPHSLDTVLRLRKLAEEQQERLLEKILLETARVEDLVNQNQQLTAAAYEARPAGGNVVQAYEVHASYAEVVLLSERATAFEAQKEKLVGLANQQRGVLQRSRQERETVGSLLDQHRAKMEVLEQRREQRTLDDVHGAQRARKQLMTKLQRKQTAFSGT